MSGVQPKQLWTAPGPETYYVIDVFPDDTAEVVLVRIEGKTIIPRSGVRRVSTAAMLTGWMPVALRGEPAPTWHERLMADES